MVTDHDRDDDGQALSDLDYRALGDFRRAMREFLAFSAAGAEALGLTSQQHQALLAIRVHIGREAMSVGELAERLLIRNHSALGLVSRLSERGLIVRSTSGSDRRRVLLALTPLGAEALQTISRRNLKQLGRASPALEQLLKALRTLKSSPSTRTRVRAR